MKIATALTARLADVASAAERCGAAAPAVARLLEAASVATMQAVALEARALVADETPVAVQRRRPVLADLREAA
jgi:hypothetical protein